MLEAYTKFAKKKIRRASNKQHRVKNNLINQKLTTGLQDMVSCNRPSLISIPVRMKSLKRASSKDKMFNLNSCYFGSVLHGYSRLIPSCHACSIRIIIHPHQQQKNCNWTIRQENLIFISKQVTDPASIHSIRWIIIKFMYNNMKMKMKMKIGLWTFIKRVHLEFTPSLQDQ